jgi:hypothetical protein
MAQSLDDLRKELDKEFNQFRERLTDVRTAMDAVEKASPTDDVEGLLDRLEDAVKKVRTGGLLGSGAKGHARARKEFLEAQGIKPE